MKSSLFSREAELGRESRVAKFVYTETVSFAYKRLAAHWSPTPGNFELRKLSSLLVMRGT
jgi:hypothetical protein